MKIIYAGVTNPKGFSATGFYAGIKKKTYDMAIIYSHTKTNTVGVFTKNVVKAAPVILDEEIIKNSKNIQAIVINSGNANACTGEQGLKDAKEMLRVTAKCLGLKDDEVLVSSTGVIGVELPIKKITKAIEENYNTLDSTKEKSDLVATAIMTTDTFSKQIAVELEIGGKKVCIGGIAKGSGMIHPNMGTMLGFITTDVDIDKSLLDEALKTSTDDSYNMISVDGDTSTNDTVIVMANGEAKNSKITKKDENYYIFKKALHFVNTNLAKLIVKDGEGASKFLTLNLNGAKTKENARVLAKSVLSSSLVKTAFFGEDANWGRIVCALGYAGVEFDMSKVNINFIANNQKIDLMIDGVPVAFNEEVAKNVLSDDAIEINIFLQEGDESATAWGCDLSYDYVKINASYRS